MSGTRRDTPSLLPERSTRGKRYKAALADEEDKADNEFWNQEFFAEEGLDEDYEEEKVSEDVPDSDFDQDDDDDDDDEDGDKDVEDDRPRRKVLKPPGRAPAAPRVARPPAAKRDAASMDEDQEEEGQDDDEEVDEEPGRGEAGPSSSAGGQRQQPAVKKRKVKEERAWSPSAAAGSFAAPPALRRTTIAKSSEAFQERQQKIQEKRPRVKKPLREGWRPMTQQELLADAARTEIENSASLKLLLAMEEETKRKAAVVKKKFQGPLVKLHSKTITVAERGGGGGLAAGREGGDEGGVKEEKAEYRVCNMNHPPPWLRRQRAPPPTHHPRCLVTGLPAKYRDPRTGQPYATPGAFARLRGAQIGMPFAPPPPPPLSSLPPTLAAAATGPLSSFGVTSSSLSGASTRFDRSKEGEQSKRLRIELALEMQKLTGGPPAPPCSVVAGGGGAAGIAGGVVSVMRGPYDLPHDLMGLLVDCRMKLPRMGGVVATLH